jgi:hypothetical protein
MDSDTPELLFEHAAELRNSRVIFKCGSVLEVGDPQIMEPLHGRYSKTLQGQKMIAGSSQIIL